MQLAITFGIFLAGILNIGLQHWEEGWRLSYGGKIVFSTTLLVSMVFMPESPRWLISNGRKEEGLQALHRIRFEEEVEIEYLIIAEKVEAEMAMQTNSGGATCVDLFSREGLMWYRTMMGFMIQLLQQCTGINTVMYFAPIIFARFLSSSGAIAANMGVSLVNFLSTFIALYLFDCAGRRILLVAGGMGMAMFTALFATFTSSLFDYTNDRGIGVALITYSALLSSVSPGPGGLWDGWSALRYSQIIFAARE